MTTQESHPDWRATSNLPFDESTGGVGTERFPSALLERLTHHLHIIELNRDIL